MQRKLLKKRKICCRKFIN